MKLWRLMLSLTAEFRKIHAALLAFLILFFIMIYIEVNNLDSPEYYSKQTANAWYEFSQDDMKNFDAALRPEKFLPRYESRSQSSNGNILKSTTLRNMRTGESNGIQRAKITKPKARKDAACENVEKDRPNWTIMFKQNTPVRCYRYKYSKWVKRIILTNKKILNRGCTKRTRKCGYRPYFDTKLQARINAPPCCRQHIIEIFRNIAKLMAKYGGRYFLAGGGLIGWYRNRSVVPYDHDIDLLVDLNFWRTRQFRLLLQALKRRHGHFVAKKSWNKLKIYYSKLNHNFVDLWPYGRKGKDKIKIKSSQFKVHNISDILPLRKSKFEGFEIWVPKNPEAMLAVEYGNGWKNELSCKKVGKYGNCKE